MLRLIAIAVLGLAVVACGAPTRKVKIHTLKDSGSRPTVVSYPADQRGGYVIPDSANVQFCAEPVPDIALDSLHKLAAEVSGKTEGVEAAAKFDSTLNTTVVEMAGRSSLLLMARELMYRTCEMHANGALDDVAAKAAFGQVLDLIAALSDVEKKDAESRLLNERRLLELTAGTFKDDVAGDLLMAYWRPGGQINDEADQAIKTWLQQNGFDSGPGSVTIFLRSGETEAARARAARDILAAKLSGE